KEALVVCRALLHQGLWDAAFSLIEALEDDELLDDLLGVALTPMLQAGRHMTVQSWVERAQTMFPALSAWVLLAQAELASRRGDQYTGELIQRLQPLADESVDSRLRLVSADLHDALRRGVIGELEDRVREGLVLIQNSVNPVGTSSLLLNIARWHVMTARYAEAVRVIDNALKLASEHRLSFVLPSV